MKTQFDLEKLLEDAQDEAELIPYLIKMELTRLGVPVIIDPVNVRDPDLAVTEGSIEYTIDAEKLIMEITYHESTTTAA
ncbi:hypothetical protein PHYNN_114 [Pantoea phage Phynn]|nr:hypothetical protein PHYNN_114 [Pantoea phage Phynn]